ncbi:unnamed protein product [Allacma fusca]|uniref:Uncharacterized protein n=1 Tax=Allacma fusca TaxID=39272 RepID=A0A8J2MA61_9HEXA|nr:unnamed protein product [Allacma fusca]
MPDIVEIGGVHCRPGKPLPKDLEEYISGAKDGVILFSLGSILKGQDMAEETRKAFDILAHPNVKLFITHGGLLSTQEAIYHGVPLVGIPVFGDQDMNVNRYVKEGIATFLEIVDVTEEDVSKAIQTILTNPAYKRKEAQLHPVPFFGCNCNTCLNAHCIIVLHH